LRELSRSKDTHGIYGAKTAGDSLEVMVKRDAEAELIEHAYESGLGTRTVASWEELVLRYWALVDQGRIPTATARRRQNVTTSLDAYER
jgi:hypothetical protein